MAVKSLGKFLDDDALDIPDVPSRDYPEGNTYRIESPDAETGLWLRALANVAVKAQAGGEVTDQDVAGLVLDDEQETELYHKVLGDTMQEMVNDGVSWVRIQRIGKYAFLYFAIGEEEADEALESGALSGNRQAPNRAARRAQAKGSRAASRAGATTTKRAASTAGTTSRPKPRQRRKAGA